MLDREKLAKDIFALVSKLFPDLGNERDLARETWNAICGDATFAHRVAAAQSSFLVPYWDGRLTGVCDISRTVGDYEILAVDGSQIYPDRHVSGAGCFLVNIGGVLLRYGDQSSAQFFSQPFVLLPQNILDGLDDIPFSRDLVDLKREEYEFAQIVRMANENTVCFVDGSIVFWPLEGKSAPVKTFFLDKYLAALDSLAQRKILVAGYISMPKSRELVNLIKLGLCRFPIADCIPCHSKYTEFPCRQVDHMLDAHIAKFILKKFQRTTVFYSTSKIVEHYPDHLVPAFVYCDAGTEIIRLEVPSWIARDRDALDRVCAIAIDQSVKGYGYPVCLAEAHEQAVVKGGDREFFYHLLCKIGIERNRRISYSEKSMKKRRIGI